MLNKIRSIYLIKIIFSFVDDGQTLKLIKYNKNTQNKININLINYRRFAKKYIIYDENKLVKEFCCLNNELIYEGEYSKGERNGKGKEYGKEGNIIYEGEYLNGKRNGKGKEYDEKGKLLFEGEYLKGKRFNVKYYGYKTIYYHKALIPGKCIYGLIIESGNMSDKNKIRREYNENGELIFEGEYINGKRNGEKEMENAKNFLENT